MSKSNDSLVISYDIKHLDPSLIIGLYKNMLKPRMIEEKRLYELKHNILRVSILIYVLLLVSCKEERLEDKYVWHTIEVTASAYNSTHHQTDSNPYITAFGDSLKPGLNYLAVSKDLLKIGLKHNTPVKIEGFDSIYFVKDRMHSRWKNRIDIYMGIDVKAARQWGRKKVSISYGIPKPVEEKKTRR